MEVNFAKREINRYMRLGVDRSDVALLVSSWGLTASDLELANEYLHEWKPKTIKVKFTGVIEGL
jgi:hypothetical protein